MRRPFFAALISGMISCAASAQAQDAAPPAETVETVQVAGLRDPDFKSYRAFAKGLDTFEQKRALAPAAPLLFRLVAAAPGAPVDGVTMRIASDTTSVQVPVSPDGTFVMPRNQQAIDENADIFLNKKRGSYRWRPHFATPDLPPNTRRLGDLRLECAVRWAVEGSDLPMLARAVAGVAGGACQSRHITVLNLAPRPLLEYSLVSGERRQKFGPYKSKAGSKVPVYWVPLHDASWPDDALVEFVYAPQA